MRCLQGIKLGSAKHYDTDRNVDIQRKYHNDYYNRQGANERKKKKSENISYFSHIQKSPNGDFQHMHEQVVSVRFINISKQNSVYIHVSYYNIQAPEIRLGNRRIFP